MAKTNTDEPVHKAFESNKEKTAKMVKYNYDKILNGKMLAIDPGSVSSGWALFRNGTLVESGSFKTKSRPPIQRMKELKEFYGQFRHQDVLAMEYIHVPNKKTVMSSYSKLLMSIGALGAIVNFDFCVEIAPVVWQGIYTLKQGRKTKSDENDAVGIGKALVLMAEEHVQGLEDKKAKLG